MFRKGLFTLAAGASLAAAATFAPGSAEARPSFGISTPGFSLYVGPNYGYNRSYYRPYYNPYAYAPSYSYSTGYRRPYAYDYGTQYRYRHSGRRNWKNEAFSGD